MAEVGYAQASKASVGAERRRKPSWGGLPPPVTAPSFGRFGVRTPAVLAVWTAAPVTGQTKGQIDQYLC
jgi:hypothetical protein